MRSKTKFWKVAGLSLALTVPGLFAQPQGPPPSSDQDEQPGRGVARISLINGEVSVKRGDTGDMTAAAINAPLMAEDSVLTGPGSRVEVQFDYANMIRGAANSEFRIAELEQQRYLVQLAAGTVTFRVLRDSQADVEVSTPSIAVRPTRRGLYRIYVRPDGSTEVTVRSGEAEIYTPRGTQRLHSGRTLLARGPNSDPEFQTVNAVPEDEWDRWNVVRDRDLERSTSYRYVSRDIYGAEDLDPYGRWVNVPPYGWVWSPSVAAGWAPYRYGRWSWVDYYGWSWVSYDPWGWAPYHYGRWFNSGPYGWCWWPGAVGPRHYWRPALVGFVGWGGIGVGIGAGFGFGNVGWIPLAPYEAYRPWYGPGFYGGYRRGGGYIDNRVTIVNNVNITNVYRNARVGNAITGVGGTEFSSGRSGSFRPYSAAELNGASLVHGQLPIAPTRDSLRMADRQPFHQGTSLASSNERFFSNRQVARVDRVPFEQQRQGIEQSMRRSFGDTGRRSDAPMAGTHSGTSLAESGWRRFGEPNQNVSPASDNSARRSGENGWRRQSAGTSAAPGESPSARPSQENQGWRRFGDNGARGSSVAPEQGTHMSGGGSRDQSGWRRFGEPSNGGAGAAPGADSGSFRRSGGAAPERVDRGGNWQRFSEAPASSGEPRGFSRGAEQSAPGSRMSSGDPGNSGRSSFRQDRGGEAVQIRPSIVQERAPSSFGGSRRGGGEAMSAPRSSGPPSSSGGGGGGGTRMSGGGGGGGGHSGGHSGGGGSGRGGRGR